MIKGIGPASEPMPVGVTHEGFHARDGWYFQRQPDGSVKISAAVSRCTETLTIPPNEWASIVAAVSAQRETSESFYAALAAHGTPS